MSKNIDIGSKTLDIVLLLFRKRKLHVRQIAREANISATTASTLLRNLHTAGIVELEVLGKNCFYSLKKSITSRKIAVMAEEKKAFDILALDNWLNNVMQQISGLQTEFGSMIDFIIVSEKTPLSLVFATKLDEADILNKIKEAEGKLKISINVKTFTKREFEEKKENLPDSYFILSGAETFVDLMLK